MLPLYKVEKLSFKRFVIGLANCGPPCRNTLLNRLKTRCTHMKHNLIKELGEADYVCTTADIWSSHHKRGVTYIDKNMLRKSAGGLNCRTLTKRFDLCCLTFTNLLV